MGIKVLKAMRSKVDTGDPAVFATQQFLLGMETLLDGCNSDDAHHDSINKLAFGVHDGDDDAAHHIRIESPCSGQASDVMFDCDAFEIFRASGDDHANGDYWYPDMDKECGNQPNGGECWPDTDDGY